MSLRALLQFRLLASAITLVLLNGCVTTGQVGHSGSTSPSRPAWIAYPKTDDSIYMYRVGSAVNQASPELARKTAYADALGEISKTIFSSVKVEGADTKLTTQIEIQGAEIMPGGLYTEKSLLGYSCWVQVSYPLSKKAKLLEQFEKSRELSVIWKAAQLAVHRGDYEDAKAKMLGLLKQTEGVSVVLFDLDDVKLALGDIYREQKDSLEARRWYETVSNMSESAVKKSEARKKIESLPEAPRFWPMNDRFGGGKVGLLCCIREGGEAERDSNMLSVLAQDCREARLQFADLSRELTKEQKSDFFDMGSVDIVQAAAAKKGVSVVLGVLLDIDPKKRGTTTKIFGTDTATIDTRAKFAVVKIDKANAKTLYSGEFKEVAGKGSDARLSKHAASVLISNYLLPKCPQVK